MEQLDYNLLYRWFVGMDIDEPIWDATVFTRNRDRLLNQEIARSFFRRVVERAQGVMSDEHFTVAGALIEAWASQNSFQPKAGGTNGDGRDFRGRQRKNDTHASTTDPDARLYRNSNGAEEWSSWRFSIGAGLRKAGRGPQTPRFARDGRDNRVRMFPARDESSPPAPRGKLPAGPRWCR